MTSDDVTQRGLERAALVLEEAQYLHGMQAWSLVVRRSQESVELALKTALRRAGLEVPRVHDVGPLLIQHADRFETTFQGRIPRLASISRRLRAERETSFYGDEASGLPPEMLYTQQDAEDALAAATEVLEACRSLIPPSQG